MTKTQSVQHLPSNNASAQREEAQNTIEEARHKVELTDQTNLLPIKKLIFCYLGLGLCLLVSQLDTTITATSLSTISSAFNAGAIASWVPTAYLLTSTSTTPLLGRLSDIFGRKITLSVALAMLMVGERDCGFLEEYYSSNHRSWSSRGAIRSLAQIIISDVVSLRDRGKYQAIIASISSIGIAVGPVIGGAIAQKAGWQWCFWFTVPVIVCAAPIINLVLPYRSVRGNIREKLRVIDYVGSCLTLTACTLFLLPLIWGGVTYPWSSPMIVGTLVGGFVTCLLFICWEWKGAVLPILPMYVFKYSTINGVYIVGMMSGMIRATIMYYLPQYFQVALGYTPIRAGVLLIPFLVFNTFMNQVAGQIMSRTGRFRMLVLTGFGIWSISCGLLSTITPHTPYALLVVYMLLSGVGSGQTLQTTTVAAQATVPRKDMAVVTAFRNFVRMLGEALGLAIGSALINNTLRRSMQDLSIPEQAAKEIIDKPILLSYPSSSNLSPDLFIQILYDGYLRGFKNVFLVNASLSATAFVISFMLIHETDLDREDDSGTPREETKEALNDSIGDMEKGRIDQSAEKGVPHVIRGVADLHSKRYGESTKLLILGNLRY
ncbi:hypothetical protein NP233_g12729 [Leucocoprinus birnbaumii]|uniref:Major facilitator superfamily (MFS) profile domain-containing protein n=1 Tax=Leucocoprinus birnbaumii TaxID=56174 RepID=A0AAD5YPR8_9AGAR|nr:hypothetical protein NP233_g12729 [Leucocoprinus birnbaumii]